VVNGLIFNRMQKLKKQSSVIATRTCRQSLGVLCAQEYDPTRKAHQQADLFIDPIDKKKYAKGQIRWFIKQGQPVKQDNPHIDHKFYRTFCKGGIEPWESQIVVSNSRLRDLPDFKQDGGKLMALQETPLDDNG
jgi:hypothetical protein